MTSLPDEFAKLFPQPSPELLARLAELDATPDSIKLVAPRLALISDDLHARADTTDVRLQQLFVALGVVTADVAELNTELNADRATWVRRISDLAARVAALEGKPPPPPPPTDTVHVGPATKIATVNVGWAVIQKTSLDPATAKILDRCSAAKKMHLGPGFGPSSPIQEFAGGPIDFSYHDEIYGAPGTTNGYFGATGLRVLTAYSCPPYMRVPKPGTAPMPNPVDMALYAECPPHWSHHDDYAILLAAFVDRYLIDVLEDRNEWKGEATGGTQVAGSVMVPPGSGLPSAGPPANRWCVEHHTDCWNHIVRRVRAVRPECKLAMGYMVTRTYQSATNPDSANDAFPMKLNGPWGHADKKAMRAMLYMIANADDFDYICLDTKTSVNDAPAGTPSISPENQWSGLQKVLDWEQWFNDLADWDPARYGRAKDAPTWYAEAYSRVPSGLLVGNHPEAVATDAWGITNYIFRSRAVGWMRWQTEGERKAGVDSASAHSIALVNALGSPKSLQPTEAVPVYAGLVEHFPPDTQLYSVDVDDPLTGDILRTLVSGIASDTTLCLVSRSADFTTLTFRGEPLVLAPYDVKFVPR